MKRDVLKRRVWLIDTIAQNDGISLKHLQEKWLKSEVNDQKTPLNERTFHRDKDDILIIFGIEIKCERNAYFIKNKEEFKGNSFINWLMNSFTISNLLQEWKSMRERILLEEIPSSREFLIPIITAMDRSVQIEFVYQRFQEAEEKSYRLSPYCVKIFNQRWYVVGEFQQGETTEIRTYALDRIKKLSLTETPFVYPKNFNPEEHFQYSFGVFTNQKEQIIHLKANAEKTKYLKSLPLHHSQREISTDGNNTIFQYYLRPTYDFRQELLSHGNEVEVLSPVEFREEMRKIVAEMHHFYEK